MFSSVFFVGPFKFTIFVMSKVQVFSHRVRQIVRPQFLCFLFTFRVCNENENNYVRDHCRDSILVYTGRNELLIQKMINKQALPSLVNES